MKRISKILLINAQRHKRLEIAIGPEQTGIIGDNNAGKSTLTRCIKWLMTNSPSGNWMQREDGDGKLHTTEVHIWYEDGTKISRIKSSKINKYIMSNEEGYYEEWEKFGTEVPAPIKAFVGQLNFKVGSANITPTIHEQDDKAFMVFESGPARGGMVSYLTGIDIGDKAKREFNKEANDHNKQVKRFEEILCHQKLELEDLGETKGYGDKIANVKLDVKRVDKTRDSIINLESLHKRSKDIDVAVKSSKDNKKFKEAIKQVQQFVKAFTKCVTDVAKASETASEVARINSSTLACKNNKVLLEGIKKLHKAGQAISKGHVSLADARSGLLKVGNIRSRLSEIKKEKKQVEEELLEYDGTPCPTCGKEIGCNG